MWLNASKKNNYNPNIEDLSEEVLLSTSVMYLCFPSNPHGAVTDLDYLKNN